jgi:hypothetical protein
LRLPWQASTREKSAHFLLSERRCRLFAAEPDYAPKKVSRVKCSF